MIRNRLNNKARNACRMLNNVWKSPRPSKQDCTIVLVRARTHTSPDPECILFEATLTPSGIHQDTMINSEWSGSSDIIQYSRFTILDTRKARSESGMENEVFISQNFRTKPLPSPTHLPFGLMQVRLKLAVTGLLRAANSFSSSFFPASFATD